MKKILLILGILVVACLFITSCVPPAPAGETVVFTEDDETDDVDEVDDEEEEETEEDDEDAVDDEAEKEVEEEVEEDVETQVIVSEEGSVSQEDLDDLKAGLDSMDIEDLGGLSE